MVDNQLPLLGVIICCTSIEPERRSEIASVASQMGAIHKLDLTSDVTHLIVGDSDTPKYKFVARERPDVTCLLPSWIDAVRASWMEGGETDVNALETAHKLPTLTGLRVCVTGFDDLVYRKELEDLINGNGGDYHGNLTKDMTHLIAKEPSGAKYNFAAQWGIKTVSVEWLEQSLERGMILEESLYHLLLPPSERGRNAWIRKSFSTTSLGKRARDDEIVPPNARKLRRTASARLSTHNDGLWGEINGGQRKAEEIKVESWDEPKNEPKTEVLDHPKSSDAAQVKISTSAQTAASNHPLKRSQSEANLSPMLCKVPQQKGLFHGKTFLLRGFVEKKTAILEEHLSSHGAQIIDDFSQLPAAPKDGSPRSAYILIPHTSSDPESFQISQNERRPVLVTDLWVERCLYRKQFEEPQARITNTPFLKFPVSGFEALTVCSTGFQGIDLVHMHKTVTLMGANYDEFFTPKASVLLCNAVIPGHEKLFHAQRWGVPAVKAEWLWDCARRSESMPFGPYFVQPLRDPSQVSKNPQAPVPQDVSAKAHKSEKTPGKPDETSKTHKKPLPPAEKEDKHLANDTPSSSEQVQIVDPNPWSTTTKKPSHTKKKQSSDTDLRTDKKQQDTNSTNHTTQSIHSDLDSESSHTLRPTSGPLYEISPNTSQSRLSASPQKLPEPSASAQDMPSPSKPDPTSSSSLGPAISSLLAHHQRASTNPKPPASSLSDQPQPYRRRRRQLFGRAPSNLSSSHSINLSRASSVDTMNTDGLGTPLESCNNVNKPDNSNKNNASKNSKNTNINTNNNSNLEPKPMWTTDPDHDHDHEDPDREDQQPLQMTQLGYEDETVKAWRERVDVKMGVVKYGKGSAAKGKGGGGSTPGGKEKEKGGTMMKGRDSGGGAGLGISKRTRLATGGGGRGF